MGIGASTPRKDPPRSNMVRLHTVDNAKLPMPEQPELERRFTKVLGNHRDGIEPLTSIRFDDRFNAVPLFRLVCVLCCLFERSVAVYVSASSEDVLEGGFDRSNEISRTAVALCSTRQLERGEFFFIFFYSLDGRLRLEVCPTCFVRRTDVVSLRSSQSIALY
ncbi:hypothetical protein MRX96_005689 [Rhipicephalus microplus]